MIPPETKPRRSRSVVETATLVRPRSTTRWRLAVVTFTILGGIALAGLLAYAMAPTRYNVLIIGSDQRGTERARSDVLMVFSIPKSPNQPLSLITIPRDTKVELAEYGMQKITHAYALGDRPDESVLGNVNLTQQAVEELLGIQIDATAEFTFESFKDMVDFAGGVETDQGHVDGEAALKVVRNRYREGGDFARTQDQRDIFLDLARRVSQPSQAKGFYDFFQQHEQTRLQVDTGQAMWFGAAAAVRRGARFDLTNTYTDFVPGKGQSVYTPEFDANLYYWVIDSEKTTELVDHYLR